MEPHDIEILSTHLWTTWMLADMPSQKSREWSGFCLNNMPWCGRTTCPVLLSFWDMLSWNPAGWHDVTVAHSADDQEGICLSGDLRSMRERHFNMWLVKWRPHLRLQFIRQWFPMLAENWKDDTGETDATGARGISLWILVLAMFIMQCVFARATHPDQTLEHVETYGRLQVFCIFELFWMCLPRSFKEMDFNEFLEFIEKCSLPTSA